MAQTDGSRAWARRALVVLVTASTACRAAPAGDRTGVSALPIVGGTPSDEAQDAVVLVLHSASDSPMVEICSGTMLTPRLVLTARHCVASVDPYVACTSDGAALSGGAVSSDYPASEMYVYGGAQRTDLSSVLSNAVQGLKIIDDGATTLCNHDLALILLQSDVPGTKIAPVRLDGGTQIGEETTIIGWGIDDTGGLARTRRQRAGEEVLAVGPSAHLGLGSSELMIGQGACEGDSGGPALAASGAVIGLLSRGGRASGATAPGLCADDELGQYTAPSGFSSLILGAYAEAGQDPWLEGEPGPAPVQVEDASADADEEGASCAVASRPGGADLLVVALALLLFVFRRAARGSGARPLSCRAGSRGVGCGSSRESGP